MDSRTIPAFYGCYLLRSTVRPSSLYVGSTPNPVRRLAQHNGRSKGGAVRTSKESLRPWEMACIISGFPSQIAALQFEWAWQNTHTTRHIPAAERITEARSSVRVSSKTGRTRRHPLRPRMTLTDKIANLHLLLCVDSFKRWPLVVTFFCEDVYRVWRTWSERVQASIGDGLQVVLDLGGAAAPAERESAEETHEQPGGRPDRGGIECIEVGYAGLKGHLQKSMRVLANSEHLTCAICRRPTTDTTGLIATCTAEACEAVSHLKCLSDHFLSKEMGEDVGPVLPRAGTCPTCERPTQWIDIVKELSLRTRGHREVEKLMKKPRTKKYKGTTAPRSEPDTVDDEDREQNNGLVPYAALNGSDASLPDILAGLSSATDDWRYVDEDDNDDDDGRLSVISATTEGSHISICDSVAANTKAKNDGRLEIVIEDSESDGAEVLG